MNTLLTMLIILATCRQSLAPTDWADWGMLRDQTYITPVPVGNSMVEVPKPLEDVHLCRDDRLNPYVTFTTGKLDEKNFPYWQVPPAPWVSGQFLIYCAMSGITPAPVQEWGVPSQTVGMPVRYEQP